MFSFVRMTFINARFRKCCKTNFISLWFQLFVDLWCSPLLSEACSRFSPAAVDCRQQRVILSCTSVFAAFVIWWVYSHTGGGQKCKYTRKSGKSDEAERMRGKGTEHRYRLILFQMRLGFLNNISHTGTFRHSPHFLHAHPSWSFCLPASLAAQFYILLNSYWWDWKANLYPPPSIFPFMFVPFVPLLPSIAPQEGKDFFNKWQLRGFQSFNRKLWLSLKESGIIWDKGKGGGQRSRRKAWDRGTGGGRKNMVIFKE